MSTAPKKRRRRLSKRHLAEPFIASLLSSNNVEDACKAVGIGRATATRWMSASWFAKRYREARRAVVGAAVGQLSAAQSEAVIALRTNLTDVDPRVRNSAASAILSHGSKMAELFDLDERLTALEAKADPPGQ